jgi:5,10-methylenetetrahydromethanopterin reductase
MRIGLFTGATATGTNSVSDNVAFVREAERRGFDTVWMANAFGLDAVACCGIAGWATERIELGTAITPTYPRHPAALAQQALTTSSACNRRFALGIGLSHQVVIEGMFGMSYDKPARHMREYLEIIAPLLRGDPVNFNGEQLTAKLSLDIAGGAPVPLIVAALGSAMLKLAGTLADGTTTWMTGPKTLEQHIIPGISSAATAAGRPAPRIVCGMPIALTNQVDAAREEIAKQLKIYGMLPSYQAMLEMEEVSGPAELAMVGDEATLRAGIQRLRDVGVTDFNAAIMDVAEGVFDNTLDFLQSEIA